MTSSFTFNVQIVPDLLTAEALTLSSADPGLGEIFLELETKTTVTFTTTNYLPNGCGFRLKLLDGAKF